MVAICCMCALPCSPIVVLLFSGYGLSILVCSLSLCCVVFLRSSVFLFGLLVSLHFISFFHSPFAFA